jgi:hypothetical protein
LSDEQMKQRNWPLGVRRHIFHLAMLQTKAQSINIKADEDPAAAAPALPASSAVNADLSRKIAAAGAAPAAAASSSGRTTSQAPICGAPTGGGLGAVAGVGGT